MVTGLCHHLSVAGGFIGARMGAAGGEQGCSKPFLPSALHHPRWGWGLCRGILTPTRAALSRGAGAERDVLDPRVQPRGGAAQLPPRGDSRPQRDPRGQGRCRAACEGCCCAGGGCWPPATCWAAAGTAAARAGTTPAGPRAPTGLAATATPTARGRATAARTTRPRAAAPVSVGMGRGGQARPLGCRLMGLTPRDSWVQLGLAPGWQGMGDASR